MLILKDLLSPEEVAVMKQHWRDHHENKYVNWVQDDGKLIDHRLLIYHTPHFRTALSDTIDRLIGLVFDPAPIQARWAALQRQTNPHAAHVDDFGLEQCQQDSTLRMYTYIIALDTVPEFRTIVWQEVAASNDEMIRMLPNFTTRRSHLSESEDLEHVCRVWTDSEPDGMNLGDALTLDGIFAYEAGAGCVFDGKQIHTTSNWSKYPQHHHRDLLQIHVLTHQQVDLKGQ